MDEIPCDKLLNISVQTSTESVTSQLTILEIGVIIAAVAGSLITVILLFILVVVLKRYRCQQRFKSDWDDYQYYDSEAPRLEDTLRMIGYERQMVDEQCISTDSCYAVNVAVQTDLPYIPDEKCSYTGQVHDTLVTFATESGKTNILWIYGDPIDV